MEQQQPKTILTNKSQQVQDSDSSQQELSPTFLRDRSKKTKKSKKSKNSAAQLKLFKADSYETLPSVEEFQDTFDTFKHFLIKSCNITIQTFGFLYYMIRQILQWIFKYPIAFIAIMQHYCICLRKLNKKDPLKRKITNSNFIRSQRISLKGSQQQYSDPSNRYFKIYFDIDNTLVHVSHKQINDSYKEINVQMKNSSQAQKFYVKLRPQLKEFLNLLNQKFILNIFTTQNQEYADAILNIIEEGNSKLFNRKYYKQDSIKHPEGKNGYIRDIYDIDNNYSKTSIIIDSNRITSQLNIDNTIIVDEYKGQEDDTTLDELLFHINNISKDSDFSLQEQIEEIKEFI